MQASILLNADSKSTSACILLNADSKSTSACPRCRDEQLKDVQAESKPFEQACMLPVPRLDLRLPALCFRCSSYLLRLCCRAGAAAVGAPVTSAGDTKIHKACARG